MKVIALADGSGKQLYAFSRESLEQPTVPPQGRAQDCDKDTVKVMKDGQKLFLHGNESIFFLQSVTHRIESCHELHTIEVRQAGSWKRMIL